ncbi:CRISPR system precrRNA processing endoribonuclease RAMP protein Cas6 [uncultured Azohydromonas sp.]|uniref:CRISPR system precrRNA processing endoribonuclease RAMP protein Cas6 n=1 Tax=uncultured Azohydromonas sp. TaxID=487342 RepID=UPI00261A320F|nr:CRISPR system precrRNA processing endoribonuclease RAMP protein Cas6 [uncultured Azohydromonas sp.]
MTPPLALPLARYCFTAVFEADLVLPDYAGALLRSCFGAALRETVCSTGRDDCKACPLYRSCAYPALFETPPRPTQFEQRFSQVPNPYIIEPPRIGCTHVPAGQALSFHMVLIGAGALRQLPLVVQAWKRALRQGLGQARVRGALRSVSHVDADRTHTPAFDLAQAQVLPHAAVHALPLELPRPLERLQLLIDTPLRLQNNGRPLRPQELSPRTLISQLLRRVNLLLDLHMDIRPAPFDGAALVAAAATLQDDRSQLHWKDWARYSARQGQEMNLGGVLGRWTLYGELAPLLPWLTLGQWLHLGKNATMGLGQYGLATVTAH